MNRTLTIVLAIAAIVGLTVAVTRDEPATATYTHDLGIPYGWDEPFDVAPPQQLHVIYTDASWALHTGSTDAWGGDASLAWADADCLDAGGTPEWFGGQSMTCWDVDY